MSDFGIKVTLPGNDVATASDAQLLFSSSWPNLKVFTSLQFQQTIPANSPTIVLYNHALGFVPAFIPYGGLGGSNNANGVAEISRQSLFVDNQNIYFLGGNPHPITLDIYATLFYLNIEQAFTAPVVNTGSSISGTPDKDFGIKLSKANKDISSKDMRDFLLHSSARSPMVHAVVPGVIPGSGAGVATFSYTHDLSYNPMFFAYVSTSAGVSSYFLINGVSGLNTTGNTITIKTTIGSLLSIIILKDPFTIVDNVINVSL